MKIDGKYLGCFSLTIVKEILSKFVDAPLEYNFEDNEPVRKKLSVDFLMSEGSFSKSDANELHRLMIEGGYLHRKKLTPTERGMAVVVANGLPRIGYAKAVKIYKSFLEEVATADRDYVTFCIGRVGVFGSFILDRGNVGDIDVFLEIQVRMDLPEFDGDVWLEIEELTERLKISDYLSFHDRLGLPLSVDVADVRIDYTGRFYDPKYEPELPQ